MTHSNTIPRPVKEQEHTALTSLIYRILKYSPKPLTAKELYDIICTEYTYPFSSVAGTVSVLYLNHLTLHRRKRYFNLDGKDNVYEYTVR